MRILYIYKDYFGRRGLYGRYLSENGHDVTYLLKKNKRKLNQITVNEIKFHRPDLIWFLNAFYVKYNPVAMDYIESKKIPIVFYHGVGGRFPYTDWLNIWKKFTFIFAVPYDFHRYLKKNGINSYYMPFGFHPTQYFKSVGKEKHNVSFAGTIDPTVNPKDDDRCIYLNSLKRCDKVVAFSESFKNKLHKNISVKSCKSHKEHRKVFAETKINLDLPFFSGACSFMKNKYHFRNRFFEVPATCNFLLSLRTKEFLNIFDEDTVGYYDNNVESLKESVEKYLKDSKIRKKMARKSYKVVHEKHTFAHRFRDMCKIIES